MKPQSVDLNELESIFFSVGIIVDLDEPTEVIEMDSMTFISLIIELENYYGKAIPMELMNIDHWCTVEKITESIHQVLGDTPRTELL